MSKLINSIVSIVEEVQSELDEQDFNGDMTISADLPTCANLQELQEVLRSNLDYIQDSIQGAWVDSFEIFDETSKMLSYFYPYDYHQEHPDCDTCRTYRIGIDGLNPNIDITKAKRVKVMVFDA